MKKLIINGKVAVIHSRDYGVGWSTCYTRCWREFLTMDQELAFAVLTRDLKSVTERFREVMGEDSYLGLLSIDDLKLKWIDEGSTFEVTDYDGLETVHVIGERDYLIA